MKKTILVPTDFTMESLNLFKHVMQTTVVDVNVVFLHCLSPSDSIIDMLFSSSDDIAQSLVTRDFKEACSIIKNRYGSHVSRETVSVFRGRNHNAFMNFLDASNIEEIVVPKDYEFAKPHSRSVDPMFFIRDTGRNIIQVSWQGSKTVPEKNQLAELFNIAT